MILAAIGDIGGNWPALDAVLRWIDAEGIQTLVNTGDCAVGAPWPNEVIDTLRRRNVPTVQGESDRRLARFHRNRATLGRKCSPAEFEALRRAHAACRSENLEFLGRLPRTLRLTVDGIAIGVIPGDPASPGPDAEGPAFLRLRESMPVQILVIGGARGPFARWAADTLIVNPGSVGKSGEEGVARLAIISTETEPWPVEFPSVFYETPRALSGAEKGA